MLHAYSPRVDAALALAALTHKDQTRKGTPVPYIIHPVHVAMILLRHGAGEDLVVAGLLHDVVEDSHGQVTVEHVHGQFGARVAELVAAVTQPPHDAASWKDVKAQALEHLRQVQDRDVLVLKGADTLHNMSALRADVERHGQAAFARFKPNSPQVALWYYGGVADLVSQRLEAHPLAAELAETLRALRSGVAAAQG